MSMLAWIHAAARQAGQTIGAWWGSLWQEQRTYHVRVVEDPPPRLKRGILYVVAEGDTRIYASMACPLGRCRDAINLNLLPDEHPVWTLNVDAKGRPSTRPSVWRRTSCGCHFWMRNGRLDWC